MGGGAKVNEIIVAALPLETLAEMANEAAELAERDMVSALQRAHDCGRYLVAAKAQIPHGQWMQWVRVNFDRELRTASRYMQIAEAFPTRGMLDGVVSVRHAMRLIAQDTEPDPIVVSAIPEAEAEPELQEIETEQEETEENEPQERPTIRKVTAESRKVPEAQKPKTPEVATELVEEPEEVVLYRRDGQAYYVADADDVAVAALQLYEPMALVRIAVLAVEPQDLAFALDELQQAVKWVRGEIEEAGRD
jgi:hypothetical protein